MVYERELIGLVLAVRHWRPYLWGRPFIIKTDHYSLKLLLDQKLTTVPQHQWVSKLFGFDFSMEYKSGTANVIADALSQRDMESTASLIASSAPSFRLFDDLCQEFDASWELCMVRNAMANRNHGDQWRVIDGLVIVRGRVYIPSSSSLAQEAIVGAHGTSHEGVQKTLHRLRVDFFMLAARAVVQDFVRACDIYQCHRTEQLQPAGLLPPLDFLSTVWTDMSMDFIEGLLRVNGKSVILTVVDRFSKAAHFIPLAHPYTTTTVFTSHF
jgi:hypothetical protein